MLQGHPGATDREVDFIDLLGVERRAAECGEQHEDEENETGHGELVLAELTPGIAPQRALLLDHQVADRHTVPRVFGEVTSCWLTRAAGMKCRAGCGPQVDVDSLRHRGPPEINLLGHRAPARGRATRDR